LYYCWTELIKNSDDIASIKTLSYKKMYDSKLNEILLVISKKNDNVKIYGQTQMER